MSFLLILLCGGLASAQNAVYVTNTDLNNVVVVDPVKLSTLATIQVGIEPIGAAVSPDGSRLYVMNGGSSSVSVIDTTDNTVVSTIPVVGFPIDAAFSLDGTHAYVTDGLGAAVIDVATNTVLSHILLGTNGNHVVVTADGSLAYISGGNGTVYAADLHTNTMVASIPIPGATDLRRVALTPDGKHLYVVSVFQSEVFAIDTATNSITATIPVGFLPIGMAITPDGTRAYVAASFGPVSVLDLGTNIVLTNITVINHPDEVAISDDGTRVYVSDQIQAVAVIDAQSSTVIAEIPTGGHPSGVALVGTPPGVCKSQLSVASVQPAHGGDAGSVTVVVTGCNFQDDAIVKLVGADQVEVGTNTRTTSPSSIKTTFDLRSLEPGLRDLVVTNGDGSSSVLSHAFTIEAGGTPVLKVGLIGLEEIRPGRAQTYYVQVTNAGSVDSDAGLVTLNVPSGVGFLQQSGDDLFVLGNTSDAEFLVPTPSNTISDPALLFATPRVPAGGAVSASLQLTLPTGTSLSSFVLSALWQQDLTGLALDDLLGLEQIPFLPFPTSGCAACLNQFAAELSAHSAVLTAYNALQTAQENLNFALLNLPISIGQTVLAATAVEALGMPELGGVALSLLIEEGKLCAQNLYADVTRGNKSCFADLKGQLVVSGNAAIDLLRTNQTFSATEKSALSTFAKLVGILTAAIDGAGSVFDAYSAEQVAIGNFQQALGPYRLARAAYQACLSRTVCAPLPRTPPPPPLPGTSLTVTGVASLDPNEKIGSQGIGDQRFVSGGAPLHYAVFFSNKAAATAPAQDITVTDQLNTSNDDLKSVSLGPIVFGDQLITPPSRVHSFSSTVDLRPANNLLVKIDAALNLSSGLLTWHFTSLDPATNQRPLDPTVGFLPPGGEGSMFFTVMPKGGTPTNAQISNQATIVFDANAPIPTQTWFNTIDNDKPQSHVLTLPTQSPTTIPLQWAGADVGAGVQDFTVFTSDNGGPFTPFLTNTSATSATFPGKVGHTYAFFSTARDLVGNVEGLKTTAEATTSVAADAIPPTTLAVLAPPANANGWNNSDVTVSLSATDDPGGSGVQQITFSATGAQPVASTNLAGSSASALVSTEGITNFSFFATDLAANVEAAHTLAVKLDKMPPSITGARTPAANANGWNNTDVSISFGCADALSGLAPGSPPAATVLSTEGTSQQVGGTCLDLAGNSASATASGINIDKTPPVLSGLPAANCTLWPPNHKFVTVSTISAADRLSGMNSFSVTGTSNEPMDPNDPDIIITGTGLGPRTVQLRADRLGTGTGRVYILATTATDAAGNVVNAASICTVPHDQAP